MTYDRLLRVVCGLQHLWIVLTSVVSGQSAYEPGFLGPLKNVTVVQGKDASFTCMVDNLGGHRSNNKDRSQHRPSIKIAWIKVDTKAILAIHDNVITNNARLSVTMNDKVTWTLHVKNVQQTDAGRYMCQINTEPMRKQMAYLEVVIPPDIISEETSGDVMVPEGGTAKLICRAKGHPKPVITWRKEDGNPIIIKEHNGHGGKRKVKSFEGEMLSLSKIVRSEMGAYLCIASNGVPPSVSKRILVSVHFHPLIQVPNQMVAAPKGTDITIECTSEASPRAINYWTRESGEMIISNEKYNMTEEATSQYGVRMKLQIKNLSKERDFTGYKCISQNSMGNTEGTISIHEIPHPPSDKGSNGDKLPPPADATGENDNHHQQHHHHHNRESVLSTLIPLVEQFQPIDTPVLTSEGNNNHPISHHHHHLLLLSSLSFTLTTFYYLLSPRFYYSF